eukprot:TRINITY_DN20862_c0_g1_i1.p1 TRINITY_DN20862_c0_g1~~TRINITY_DN20862_c0_g1_i1.p1  ORF type:complete len:650 (+),score=108.75 TRINITY_DN20862_c0_g1_i1:156-2105(+)
MADMTDEEILKLLEEEPPMPKEIMHGEFMLNGTKRKYAFLRKEDLTNKAELQRLCQVWKLPLPNLAVLLNTHGTLFENYVTEEMLECDSYQKFISTLDTTPDLAAVNEHVLNRLKTIYGSVAVACDMTNSWLMCKHHPAANHLLFREALEESQASPVILTIDNPFRGDYIDSFRATGYRLLKTARSMKEKPDPNPISLKIPLSERFMLEPDAVVPQADGTEKAYNINDDNWDEVPGVFQHLKAVTPWQQATHFFFTTTPDAFAPEILGTSGYILVGGGYADHEFDLLEALKTGSPALFVDSTGREVQQYSRLIRETLRLFEEENMRTAAQLRTKSEHLMAFATKGTARYYGGAYGMTQLTLPEVLRIIDMVIDRPTYFKETLMVVDVLEDSADDVVRKISKSFASKSTHALEMGAGNSDANVAMQAWKLHMVLTANSATLWKRDAFLMTWAAIFTLFGTVSAVLIAVLDTGDLKLPPARDTGDREHGRYKLAMIPRTVASLEIGNKGVDQDITDRVDDDFHAAIASLADLSWDRIFNMVEKARLHLVIAYSVYEFRILAKPLDPVVGDLLESGASDMTREQIRNTIITDPCSHCWLITIEHAAAIKQRDLFLRILRPRRRQREPHIKDGLHRRTCSCYLVRRCSRRFAM